MSHKSPFTLYYHLYENSSITRPKDDIKYPLVCDLYIIVSTLSLFMFLYLLDCHHKPYLTLWLPCRTLLSLKFITFCLWTPRLSWTSVNGPGSVFSLLIRVWSSPVPFHVHVCMIVVTMSSVWRHTRYKIYIHDFVKFCLPTGYHRNQSFPK